MRSDITNVRKDSRQRGPVRETYLFAAVGQFKRAAPAQPFGK